MRRKKATLIYRRTKNSRAVQLLLGHAKLKSTIRYLGIGVNDALELAEQTEVQRNGFLGRSVPLVADRPGPGTSGSDVGVRFRTSKMWGNIGAQAERE